MNGIVARYEVLPPFDQVVRRDRPDAVDPDLQVFAKLQRVAGGYVEIVEQAFSGVEQAVHFSRGRLFAQQGSVAEPAVGRGSDQGIALILVVQLVAFRRQGHRVGVLDRPTPVFFQQGERLSGEPAEPKKARKQKDRCFHHMLLRVNRPQFPPFKPRRGDMLCRSHAAPTELKSLPHQKFPGRSRASQSGRMLRWWGFHLELGCQDQIYSLLSAYGRPVSTIVPEATGRPWLLIRKNSTPAGSPSADNCRVCPSNGCSCTSLPWRS